MGKKKSAYDYYKKLYANFKNSMWPAITLAFSEEALGKYDDAVLHFKEALQFAEFEFADSSFKNEVERANTKIELANLYKGLAYNYFELEDSGVFDSTFTYLNKALKYDETDINLWRMYAFLIINYNYKLLRYPNYELLIEKNDIQDVIGTLYYLRVIDDNEALKYLQDKYLRNNLMDYILYKKGGYYRYQRSWVR
jgi:hypothetical protein